MKSPYQMSISLAVLQDLGIKLYSNVPSVISEVVANAWDADAEHVKITIDEGKIVIIDDGEGMSVEDANNKYLQVGYKRREEGRSITPKHQRKVMGRKGIGKLSLFSIAKKVEVQSMKDGKRHGFKMSAEKIEEEIRKNGGNANYEPVAMTESELGISENGTIITLTDLKKNITAASDSLRKRISRRFSILGAEKDFEVTINDYPVTISDRDYFHKMQYLWFFGKESEIYPTYCKADKLKYKEERGNTISLANNKYYVTGWIGSVENSGDLKEGTENLNKVVIMMRGKLAQEDILEDFSEGGLYSKYLIGEIHADFLDLDDADDIATTSRQEIIKDSDRYKALREWVQTELKNIQERWTGLRNEEGAKVATEIPAVKDWYNSLQGDTKNKAKRLFGKINQLPLDSVDRKILIKQGVLGFESMRYKDALESLDQITPENIHAFSTVFTDLQDIEATLYHQIVSERLKVIDALIEKVDQDAIEKVLQEHIFDNLWLLDPAWERATETEYMEKNIQTEFDKIRDAKLTSDQKTGRVDIKYRKTSGIHVIIELKRANRTVTSYELLEQIGKYRGTLMKLLKEAGQEHEPIAIICVVGKVPKDWNDEPDGKVESIDLFKAKNARVMLYSELIQNAQKAYKAFMDRKKEAGRVTTLIESIDNDIKK